MPCKSSRRCQPLLLVATPLVARLLARLPSDKSTRVPSRICGTLTLLMRLLATWFSRFRMAVLVLRCVLKASTSLTVAPSSSPAFLPPQLAQPVFLHLPLPRPSPASPLLPADSLQQSRLLSQLSQLL